MAHLCVVSCVPLVCSVVFIHSEPQPSQSMGLATRHFSRTMTSDTRREVPDEKQRGGSDERSPPAESFLCGRGNARARTAVTHAFGQSSHYLHHFVSLPSSLSPCFVIID